MQEGKCMCKKGKERFVGDEASSTRVDVNAKNKIRNKEKAVSDSISSVAASSISSSSSNEVTLKEKKVYSCSSCPREYSTQQALAGHRNAHRMEWQSLLNMPDDDVGDGKIQIQKLPCHPKLSPLPSSTGGLKQKSVGDSSSQPIDASSTIDKLLHSAPQYRFTKSTNTLKRPSLTYRLDNNTNSLNGPSHGNPFCNPTNTIKDASSRHTLVGPRNTMKGPSPRHSGSISTYIVKGPSHEYTLVNLTDPLKKLTPEYPLTHPTNTIKGPLGFAPQIIYANPKNSVLGPSLGVPHLSFFAATNKLDPPSIQYLNHPYNFAKYHDKSTLGVKRESMIYKPYQCRQLGGSTSFGKQQVIECNIRQLGTNNNYVDLRSLLTNAGSASSSRPEGIVNSKAHGSATPSFESRASKWIDVPELFLRSPSQDKRNHVDHSSQVLAPKVDTNAEDVDLDLKL